MSVTTTETTRRETKEAVTLPQVVARLEILEEMVRALSARLPPPPPPTQFEFVIRVDGREVWAGSDLPTRYPEIRREYPKAQVSIGWRSSPVVLV